jgi:cell division protein ZapB
MLPGVVKREYASQRLHGRRARLHRLDPPAGAAMVPAMEPADLIAQLRAIVDRVDALGERVQQLSAENRSLRQQHEHLASERAQLLAKNEQARSRVEAMIARLKSLEQHT